MDQERAVLHKCVISILWTTALYNVFPSTHRKAKGDTFELGLLMYKLQVFYGQQLFIVIV